MADPKSSADDKDKDKDSDGKSRLSKELEHYRHNIIKYDETWDQPTMRPFASGLFDRDHYGKALVHSRFSFGGKVLASNPLFVCFC